MTPTSFSLIKHPRLMELCKEQKICVEVCPFDALHWSAEYTYAGSDLRDLLHERDRLASWLPSVPPPPALEGPLSSERR